MSQYKQWYTNTDPLPNPWAPKGVRVWPYYTGQPITMIIQDETDHPPEIPREVIERFMPKAVQEACKPPLKDR